TKEAKWALTSLNLDGTSLAGSSLSLLLQARWLAGLTELSVFRSLRSPLEIQRLLRGLPARLRHLCLGGGGRTDDVARGIAASSHLTELRELWLEFPTFTERGARALADAPHLTSLRMLYVHDLKANSAAGKILRERFGDVARFEWMARTDGVAAH